MAYGNELRQKRLHAADLHQFSQVRLAEIFGVSLSWVKRVLQRQRETGSSQLLPFAGGKRPKLSQQQCEQVCQGVLADTDATLREVQHWLETTYILRLEPVHPVPLVDQTGPATEKVITRDGARPGCQSAEARNLVRASGTDRSGPFRLCR